MVRLKVFSSPDLSLFSPLTLHTPWEVSVLLEGWLGTRGHGLFLRWSLVLGKKIHIPSLFLSPSDNHFVSSVGLLFLWSADSIRKGTPNGLEGAFGMNNTLSSLLTILTLVHATRCFCPSPPLFTSSSRKRPYPRHLGCDCSRQWGLLWENNLRYQKPLGIGILLLSKVLIACLWV